MTRLLVLLVLTFSAAVSAQTCTTSWTAASGDWSNDANWSNGAPEASDTACITRDGTYTVTLDRDQDLAGLVLGGASGLQTLSLGRTLTSLGSGTVGPNGRLDVLNSANCATCDGLPRVEGTLTVEGTITHTASTGLLSAGGTLDIAPGGLLRVDTGVNSLSIGQGGTSTLRVRGRVLFTPGANTPRGATVYGALDLDGGTLAVTNGTVSVEGQGRWTGGAFDVAEGGGLSFRSGNGSTGVYEASGTLSGTPAGFVHFTSGSTLAAASGGLTLAVGGSGIVITPGSGQSTFFTSTGGAFTNTGRIVSSGSTGLRLQGATLVNAADLSIRTRVRMSEGARIENTDDGTVTLLDQGGMSGGPAGGLFTSAGTLTAVLDERTSASASLTVPAEFEGASIDVANGVTLQLSGGALRDVAFAVDEGATLRMTASNGEGVGGVFQASGTFSGRSDGTLVFSSGSTIEVEPGDLTMDVAGNGVVVSPGSGQVAILRSAGGNLITNRGRLVLSGNGPRVQGLTLLNAADLRVSVNVPLSEGAVLRNASGATAELASGGSIRGSGEAPGTFVNEGLALKTEGGSTDFLNALRSQPGSELRVLSGRFQFGSEDPTHYGAGVRLTGVGDVYMSPPQLMQGTVSPGTPEAAIGTLNFPGYFRMDGAAGDARLVVDVGPDGASDLVATENTIVLGGTLVVRVQEGFTPAFGDSWAIINDLRNNLPQGAFSAVEVENGPTGVTFTVDATNPGAVVLRAAASVAVSAPTASVAEGEAPVSFVLSHPASGEAFTIAYELSGQATLFEDYTLSATRGSVRALANTTATAVTLFPRRDANPNEGPEGVTFRVVPGGDASPASGAAEAGIVITDGPSSEALALDGVAPARGSNLGTVTSAVFGSGIGEGAAVRLAGPASIAGETTDVFPSGSGVSATFDLAGAPVGAYDVVVESGGNMATLPSTFQVVEGTPEAPVWASISGTPRPASAGGAPTP